MSRRHVRTHTMSNNDNFHAKTHMKSLVLVWVGLMVLLAATAGSALIPLGSVNTLLNIAIAIAKTALVALFFMHLRQSIPLLRVIAIAGLFTLGLLFILGGADFITRKIERSVWQGGQPSASSGPQARSTSEQD